MNPPPASKLPLRTEEITAERLTSILAERYSGTVVNEVQVGTVMPGTATKVGLRLAGHAAGRSQALLDLHPHRDATGGDRTAEVASSAWRCATSIRSVRWGSNSPIRR